MLGHATIFRAPPGLLRAALAALVACALLGLPAVAGAAPNQESAFQDDILLVYGTDEEVGSALDELRALGVDRVRASVFWSIVAPAAASRERPDFEAADPAQYPPAKWARYDRLVREVAARGMALNLEPTGPGPLWATGEPARADIEPTFKPSPEEYGAFVRAIGTRYSGSYTPPVEAPPEPPPDRGGEGGLIPQLGWTATGASTRSAGSEGRAVGKGPLPRVAFWTSWNEPNQPGWLTPQWAPHPARGGRLAEAAPRIYRELFGAFHRALVETGHGSDQILIGNLAPKGHSDRGKTRAIKALRFILALYCVDWRYRPLGGATAESLGCPTADQRSAFPARHPALFAVTGFAHHPYSMVEAPRQRSRDRQYLTLADTRRLHATLDGIWRAYRQGRRGPDVWFTEYGFQTNPPTPHGIPETRHGAWLNEGEYMAFRDRRVRSHAQFLLVDDRPPPGLSPDDPGYWGTFQTGIRHIDGRPKRSYGAYRMPIHMPRRVVRGPAWLLTWAMVRPAPRGSRVRVGVQFRALGGRGWRTLGAVRTNRSGFVFRRIPFRRTGWIRFVYPTGDGLVRSRAVGVLVRGR